MKRHISVYSNNYGAWGVRTAVERIADAGLDCVELALRGHDFGGLVIPESAIVNQATPESSVLDFLGRLRHHKVSVSGCNVGGPDLRTPAGLATISRRVRFAQARFDARIAVSNAGRPEDAAERRLVVAHLKILGDLADELGMMLTLETHSGPTQNADAMLELMAELDHPRIGLNFDTGNIAYYNAGADPLVELDRVKHLVRSVHLKDCRGGFEDWYFPALGDGGAIDFEAVRKILDGVGFRGPYTIEIEGIGGEPEPGLEERHRRVVRSIEHLRARGYFGDH